MCFLTKSSGVLCLTLLYYSYGFNVDVNNAVVFNLPDGHGEYFGYSVGLVRKPRPNIPYGLFVGAPLSENSLLSASRPGALYICRESKRGDPQCSRYEKLDTGKVPFNGNITEKKSGQLLGSSLDAVDGYVTVCGHLWKQDARNLGLSLYAVNGRCIGMPLYPHNVKTVSYLIPDSPLWDIGENRQVGSDLSLKYITSLAGFSAHITNKKVRLNRKTRPLAIYGAVGVNDFQGTTIRRPNLFQEDINKPSLVIPEISLNDGMHDYSYFGYSVSSGRFLQDGQIYYLAGVPRKNLHGEAVIYNIEKKERYVADSNKTEQFYKVRIMKTFAGDHPQPQLGEYFGATVCGIDLNGDGLDDVLVGAPMHSYRQDEGRVYIYISQGLVHFSSHIGPLTGDKRISARFGSAISPVGDLNKDSFNDVVIGAPFEDDGAGAIYVYHGSKTGLQTAYKQRISGQSFQAMIKGFGWSISRGTDIDNVADIVGANKRKLRPSKGYVDFAVGAFQSDTAILFRTRPVVEIAAYIEFNSTWIPRMAQYLKEPSFNVTACFSFSDSSLPWKELDVNYSVVADVGQSQFKQHRLAFLSNESFANSLVHVATVKNSLQESCTEHAVYVKDTSKDWLTPVIFSLTYDLVSAMRPPCSNACPMLNHYVSNTVTNQILFARQCGEDEVCTTDLILFGNIILKREKFVSGRDNTFFIEIMLENIGEDSYNTEVVLSMPSFLEFRNVITEVSPSKEAVMCSSIIKAAMHDSNDEAEGNTDRKFDDIMYDTPEDLENNNFTEIEIVCQAGNPLYNGTYVNFTVELLADSSLNEITTNKINMEVTALSASKELPATMDDNTVHLGLQIDYVSDLVMYGVSNPEQIAVLSEDSTMKSDGQASTVKQSIDVHNDGPSHILASQIDILIPIYNLDIKKQVVIIRDLQMRDHNFMPIKTHCSGLKLNHTITETEQQEIREVHSRAHLYRSSNISNEIIIHCKNTNCSRITCNMSKLDSGESHFIEITLTLLSQNISSLQDNLESAHIVTDVTVKLLQKYDEVTIQPDETKEEFAQVSSTITFPRVKQAALQDKLFWVYVGIGSGAATLLFSILMAVLWKCGFFTRELKLRLQTSKMHYPRTTSVRRHLVSESELNEVVDHNHEQSL